MRFVFPILVIMMIAMFFQGEASEEKIVGLEEFLMELDPNTSDIILELLEAQQLPTNKGNRMMKRIMRKLPPDVLDELFQIYKETRGG